MTQKQAEVLLLQDVPKLGRSGDILSVKAGYARNFLIPSGQVIAATAQAKRLQARLQEERFKKAALDKQEAEVLASRIEGISVSIEVKVDPEGHMYGSVAALDIVHLLEAEGIKIEKHEVQLAHAIKKTGVHDIALKLKEGVLASFKLKVNTESEDAEEASEESE